METEELYEAIISEEDYTNAPVKFLELISAKTLGYRELDLIQEWMEQYLTLRTNQQQIIKDRLEEKYGGH